MTDTDAEGSGSILVPLVFLGIAVALIGGGFYIYQSQQEATDSAVEVEGTVLGTDIDETTRSDDAGTQEVYSPRIQYQYSYEGKQYASSNICPGVGESCDAIQSSGERSDVESFLSDYPDGGEITVYVPTGEPSNAYLEVGESGAPTGPLIMMALGGFLLLMAIGDITYRK